MSRTWKVVGAVFVTAVFCGMGKVDVKAAEEIAIKQVSGTEGSVSVKWETVDGAERYQYVLSEGDSEIKTGEGSSFDCTVSGLKAGTSYQMSVYAYQGEEVIASTDSYEVVTSPDVSYFTVSQAGATKASITVAMEGAQGANYYFVKKTGADEEIVSEGTSDQLKVKGLTENKKYKYKVFAARKSAEGFYAYTSQSFQKVTAKTVTGVIATELFDVTKMDFKNNKYTFGIKKGSYQVDGYELQLRTMAGEEAVTKASTGMKDIMIEDFIKGHFYKYRVRTFVSCIEGTKAYSKWSKDKYIGVGKDARGVISLKSIKITWDKVVDAKSYEVSVSLTGKDYRVIKTVSASSARKIVVNTVFGSRIRINRKYYFKIRPIAMDGKNEIKSEYTNDVVVIRTLD